MTFSVLARDLSTGRMGIAVASCVLAIGSRACRALPGIGVVSVQGGGWAEDTDVAMTALRAGASAAEALDDLRRLGRSDAQYAVLGRNGGPVSWTGPSAAAWSGDDVRPEACVHGNTLVGGAVLQASHEAWASAFAAPFEERLLQALQAGVAAGGDMRGQQSAALLSIGLDPDEPRHDLRIDDAHNPVAELQRLVKVLRAHEQLQQAWAIATEDLAEAGRRIRLARQHAPHDGLVAQCAAALLMQLGFVNEAHEAWSIGRGTIPDPGLRLRRWSETLTWLDPHSIARIQSMDS